MYVVTASAVAVSVPAGPRTSQVRFIDEGGVLPEGVPQESIDHLLSMGMIAEGDSEAPVLEQPGGEEKPIEEMSAAELKAYAAVHGIDLGNAKKVDELRAAIAAAQTPKADTGE